MAKSRARKLADIIVGAGIDIDGNLTFDGGSTSADLTFADNDKANFGDASDLQIFHNGSHSFIKDAGTGDLYIGASNNLALMNSDFSENYLLATANGAVTLYYDGSSKLATTSTGISVTGNIVTDGEIRGPATFVIDPAAVGDNTGTVQIKGNLQVDGNVYGNQLYAGGSRIANSSGYLTATVVVADDVDFVVSDGTDAITNILIRTPIRMFPKEFLEFVYKNIIRKKQ